MGEGPPEILVPKRAEPGLLWGIGSSALLHAVAIVLVLSFAGRSRHPPPMMSYTVDLVSAGDLAGTNLVPGGAAQRRLGTTASEAAPPQPPVGSQVPQPKPAEPPHEEVLQTQPVPHIEPAANPAPKPLEAASEPLPEKKAAEAPVERPPPKPAEPVERKVPPPAVAPPARPNAQVEVAKKTVTEKETKPDARQKPAPTAAVAKAPTRAEVAQPKPTAAEPAASAGKTPAALEQQIAAAVQRRAQDQKIADAVQRRAQDAQIAAAVESRAGGIKRDGSAGIGAANDGGGGPVSYGSGTGTAGAVVGVELILYQEQMRRRLKQQWVWAGSEPGLEVTIHFDISDGGEVRNVRIVDSSGNPSFDASAERAVRAASPLPPPPQKYRELFSRGVEYTFKPEDLER